MNGFHTNIFIIEDEMRSFLFSTLAFELSFYWLYYFFSYFRIWSWPMWFERFDTSNKLLIKSNTYQKWPHTFSMHHYYWMTMNCTRDHCKLNREHHAWVYRIHHKECKLDITLENTFECESSSSIYLFIQWTINFEFIIICHDIKSISEYMYFIFNFLKVVL